MDRVAESSERVYPSISNPSLEAEALVLLGEIDEAFDSLNKALEWPAYQAVCA